MMKKILLSLLSLFCIVLLFVNATIDLDNLFNYENQTIPNYITKDNTTTNPITNEVATLGRVLFYDKNLSRNNTIACASCHQQANAFSDIATQSTGLDGGVTGRHSMRLINSRFADEVRFFWDERAVSLEDQTTQPIQDHIEMGFSGTNGDPDINTLITQLSALDYYEHLFTAAFGDATITEDRMQRALAQFVRSIQSFDSKFDVGLAQVANVNQNFPNFTAEENLGKTLFLQTPPNGGAGCAGCHRPPEFDIDPNSLNNGVITVAGDATSIDLTNTRSPSLRDIINPSGSLNGPLMHDGSFTTLLQVINHYNQIPNNAANTNLDPRLDGGPGPNNQTLNLTDSEKDALVAFLGTLTGTDVYTNEKWSDPFESDGSITIIGGALSSESNTFDNSIKVFPNPVKNNLNIDIESGRYSLLVYDMNGVIVFSTTFDENNSFDLSNLLKGIYLISVRDLNKNKIFNKKIIKS